VEEMERWNAKALPTVLGEATAFPTFTPHGYAMLSHRRKTNSLNGSSKSGSPVQRTSRRHRTHIASWTLCLKKSNAFAEPVLSLLQEDRICASGLTSRLQHDTPRAYNLFSNLRWLGFRRTEWVWTERHSSRNPAGARGKEG